MKYLYVFLALAMSQHSTAQANSVLFPSDLRTQPCANPMKKLLLQLGTKGDWTRQVDPMPYVSAFRSPTHKIGQWTEARVSPGMGPKILFYTPKTTTVYSFSKGNCTPTRSTEKIPSFPEKTDADHAFTDQDLELLIRTKRNVLLYVWSPRMVYSLLYLDRFKKAAQNQGLEFLAIMDPYVTREMALLAARKAQVNLMDQRMLASETKFKDSTLKLASVELAMRNTMIHFPTSLLVSKGKISDFRILGVKTEPYIEENIKQMRRGLR